MLPVVSESILVHQLHRFDGCKHLLRVSPSIQSRRTPKHGLGGAVVELPRWATSARRARARCRRVGRLGRFRRLAARRQDRPPKADRWGRALLHRTEAPREGPATACPRAPSVRTAGAVPRARFRARRAGDPGQIENLLQLLEIQRHSSRRSLGTCVRSSAPSSVTTTSSSILTPPQPGK